MGNLLGYLIAAAIAFITVAIAIRVGILRRVMFGAHLPSAPGRG